MHHSDDPAAGRRRGGCGWAGSRRRIVGGVESDAEALADGARAGPDRPRHGFVHERDLRSGRVGEGQPPALADLEAEDVEELGRGGDQEWQLPVDRGRGVAAGHAERRDVEAGEWEGRHWRGQGHAWQPAQPLERGPEQLVLAVDEAGTALEVHQQHVIQPHAEVLGGQRMQAPPEHAGAGEQQDRERGLHDQQRGGSPPLSSAAPVAIGAAHAADLQGGRGGAERHHAAAGDGGGNRHSRPDARAGGERWQEQLAHDFVEPAGEQQRRGHRRPGEQRVLDQQL